MNKTAECSADDKFLQFPAHNFQHFPFFNLWLKSKLVYTYNTKANTGFQINVQKAFVLAIP